MKSIEDVRRENLSLLVRELGSLKALSELLGRSESQVSQWKNGAINSQTGKPRGMKSATARLIEEKTRKERGWMDISHSGFGNVTCGPDIRGRVPLVSWVQAGQWSDAPEQEPERWLLCPVNHSQSTFALRVQGDSMTSRHGKRSYPEGCIIFVDPEQRSPCNGQRIVARLRDSGETTFKVYKSEDARVWLDPLNERHDPIREPFEVIGIVIGKWEDG